MHLGSFIVTYLGHHFAAWRYPNTKTDEITQLSLYKEIAELSEKGKFDLLFIADVLAHNEEDIAFTPQIRLEPNILMASLAAVTDKIGLVSTLSTTYNHPFNTARMFATLDHLSNGRVGWNVVTSAHDNEALNFGESHHMDHSRRYERADEFVQVTKQLWDSWDDDAITANRQEGTFLDILKVRPIHYDGQFYKVRGPLNIPRSRQGHPVLISAGASETGKNFAAKIADVFFTIAPPSIRHGQLVYQDMKRRVMNHKRDADQFKIMPGVVPFVASTQKEAEEKLAYFEELVLPELGIGMLSRYVGLNLSEYSPDVLLPRLPELDQINGEKGRFQLLSELSIKENLTIKQLAMKFANGQGHLNLVGSGDYVAEQLTQWFAQGACDGFNVKYPYFPGGVKDFVDYVIPELQNRNVFRSAYEGETLRDHLGLERPTTQQIHASIKR